MMRLDRSTTEKHYAPPRFLQGFTHIHRGIDSVVMGRHCCYPGAEENRQRSSTARDRVHLLGRVAHAQVELLMRAADIFVLVSRRESSGYSLIEALACGLPRW